MGFDWNFISAFVEAIGVVITGIALICTYRSIDTGNRQNLFDKRMEVYQLIKGLENINQASFLKSDTKEKLDVLLSSPYLDKFKDNESKIEQVNILADSVDLLWKRCRITKKHNKYVQGTRDILDLYMLLIFMYNASIENKYEAMIYIPSGFSVKKDDKNNSIEEYEELFFDCHETFFTKHINKLKDSIRL